MRESEGSVSAVGLELEIRAVEAQIEATDDDANGEALFRSLSFLEGRVSDALIAGPAAAAAKLRVALAMLERGEQVDGSEVALIRQVTAWLDLQGPH